VIIIEGDEMTGDWRLDDDTQGAEVETIFREREARGLRVPIFARMVLYTYGLANVSVATRHDVEANQVELSIADDGPGIPDE
jgi:signal transduction histidine kinase